MNITGGYLGAAQAIRDELLAFAKTGTRRVGRPFQAPAHAMADLQAEIDSARPLAYRAWLRAQGMPYSRENPIAELTCSKTYVAAARLGMHVCAGEHRDLRPGLVPAPFPRYA